MNVNYDNKWEWLSAFEINACVYIHVFLFILPQSGMPHTSGTFKVETLNVQINLLMQFLATVCYLKHGNRDVHVN